MDFAKIEVVMGALINDEALRELLTDPNLECQALMADALVRVGNQNAEFLA